MRKRRHGRAVHPLAQFEGRHRQHMVAVPHLYSVNIRSSGHCCCCCCSYNEERCHPGNQFVTQHCRIGGRAQRAKLLRLQSTARSRVHLYLYFLVKGGCHEETCVDWVPNCCCHGEGVRARRRSADLLGWKVRQSEPAITLPAGFKSSAITSMWNMTCRHAGLAWLSDGPGTRACAARHDLPLRLRDTPHRRRPVTLHRTTNCAMSLAAPRRP